MKFHVVVWAAALPCFAVVGIAQTDSGESGPQKKWDILVQDGSRTPPAQVAQNQNAKALQEVARLTLEANQAFDRGDDELGKSRARAAAVELKTIEERLTKPETQRARSKLAEQRGRLQLEFLGDEAAAREAFEDSLVADENPVAERLLIELVERAERRSGSGTAPRN